MDMRKIIAESLKSDFDIFEKIVFVFNPNFSSTANNEQSSLLTPVVAWIGAGANPPGEWRDWLLLKFDFQDY